MTDIHFNSNVFVAQYPIAKRFVYHIVYHRVLSKTYNESKQKSEFWALTSDAHLLQATVLWCMIFGSDARNAIHWKRLAPDESDALQRSFREDLPRAIGIPWTQWQGYWKTMIDFRNEYVAHRALDAGDPVPSFDIALGVVYYYDEWVRRTISPGTLAEPLLKAFALRLTKSTTTLALRLIKASGV